MTTDGVYYLADSVLLGQNSTSTRYQWVNITGNLKDLAYSIYGQNYDPTADANATPYNLATALNSIQANWNYRIPNNPSDLTQGYHAVLYVAANSGVYMSTDQGQNWSLYPSTTYGATVAGGNLPHTNVSDLSLSQGNIAVANGMPMLAGPFQTLVFNGKLKANSTTVTGVTATSGLVVGDLITGAGIPAGTTVASFNYANATLTLSAGATASGNVTLSATNPVTRFTGTLTSGSNAVTGIGSMTGLVVGGVVVGTGIPAGTTILSINPTYTFSGTLTSGSASVTGIVGDPSKLVVGETVTGTDIPLGTTIVSINAADLSLVLSNVATASGSASLVGQRNGTIILSAPGTADGARALAASTVTPDPDLLLAATYGEGAFAINLAPMILGGTTAIASTDTGGSTDSGLTIVTTASPTINGRSEITGFGNATWISIYDETPGDATYGQIIGGFDPQKYLNGQTITPGSGNATDIFGNFAIPIATPFSSNSVQFAGTLTSGSTSVTGISSTEGMTVGQGVTGTGIPAGTTILSITASTDSTTGSIVLSNPATADGTVGLIAGLKTIKLVATDDAGAQSVPTTLTFLLNASNLSHPAPTQPPSAPTLELTPTTPPYATINGITVTNNTAPMLDGTAETGTYITVTETWTDPLPGYSNPTTVTFTLPAADITPAGTLETFSFAFQDFTDDNNNPINNGTFTVSVTATYDPPYDTLGESAPSNVVTFQINNTTPASVSDLRLAPSTDSGIVGDGVTANRKPVFIGSTSPGYTVELFVNGQPAAQSTATAIPGFTGSLSDGSVTVTGLSSTTGLAVGQVISDLDNAAYIPAGTTIVGIDAAAHTLTLSAPATADAAGESLEAKHSTPPASRTTSRSSSRTR